MHALNERRKTIIEFASYTASNGADEFGPIHMAVTEGRAVEYAKLKPRSTSCGDLGCLVMFAAGCRAVYVNREENRGWVPGHNLRVFLPPFGNRLRINLPRLGDLKPGDLLCYSYTDPRRTHLAVFLGLENGKAITADFGQPGGKIYECIIGSQPNKISFGGRFDYPITFRNRPLHCSIDVDTLDYTEDPISLDQWLANRGLKRVFD